MQRGRFRVIRNGIIWNIHVIRQIYASLIMFLSCNCYCLLLLSYPLNMGHKHIVGLIIVLYENSEIVAIYPSCYRAAHSTIIFRHVLLFNALKLLDFDLIKLCQRRLQTIRSIWKLIFSPTTFYLISHHVLILVFLSFCLPVF